MKQIKVLLAEDQAVLRQRLRARLEAEPDLVIVGEAETGRQAVQLTKRLLPDVVVVGLSVPSMSGLEVTGQIMKEVPATKVLIRSSYCEDAHARRLTEPGASGYLLRQTAEDILIEAIREASHGNPFFSPSISERLADRPRGTSVRGMPVRRHADLLTTREAEVLQLIAQGKPNKAIATELCISIKTVEKHRQQVMNKLNIHDVVGLTRYAITEGIVESSKRLAL